VKYETKTITINVDTWKKLTHLKADLEARNLDAVLSLSLDILQILYEISRARKTTIDKIIEEVATSYKVRSTRRSAL